MEILFEIVLELLFEGGIEISQNRKISKWIRYPIAVVLVFFLFGVLFSLFLLGALICKKNLFGGIFILLVAFVMTCAFFVKGLNYFINGRDEKR